MPKVMGSSLSRKETCGCFFLFFFQKNGKKIFKKCIDFKFLNSLNYKVTGVVVSAFKLIDRRIWKNA